MHPAFSVIFFTTASGAGYGLLALIGLLGPAGLLPADPRFGGLALGLALVLVSLGLLASTLHLGRPERAWRAFSQWRSSWLSREGVAAVATYVPALVLAAGWVLLGRRDGLFALAGIATAAMAAVTVWCTAMIYRTLKPVHQWANDWVIPGYAALALATGALWLTGLLALWDAPRLPATVVALAGLGAAAWVKLQYWRFIDTTAGASTPQSATGLSRGPVRLFERPHTADNYLLQEMGYRIARKHAAKLRRLALAGGVAAPAALLVLSWLLPPLALIAAVLATAGALVERWLFFAEAKHTVTLYYGATAV